MRAAHLPPGLPYDPHNRFSLTLKNISPIIGRSPEKPVPPVPGAEGTPFRGG